jgi:histidine phosphotransferase ChpT
MLSDIELLELLSVKICHDLAGPIGAISNGLDLMEDADAIMQKKALELIEDCSKQAINRLKLFRKLYGMNLEKSEANLTEIKLLLDNYFLDTKISLNWPADNLFISYYTVDNLIGKLLIALVLAGSSFLVSGGIIGIKFHQLSSGCELIVSLSSVKNMKIDQTSLDILQCDIPKAQLDTKNIQFYLIRRFANLISASLTIVHEPALLSFVVKLS